MLKTLTLTIPTDEYRSIPKVISAQYKEINERGQYVMEWARIREHALYFEVEIDYYD